MCVFRGVAAVLPGRRVKMKSVSETTNPIDALKDQLYDLAKFNNIELNNRRGFQFAIKQTPQSRGVFGLCCCVKLPVES